MTLSELRRRGGGNVGGNTVTVDDPRSPQGQGQSADLGTIRNAVAYNHPINAVFRGQPVNLIATGDIVGMSPAEKFVDEHGKIDWASSDEITVDDRYVVPQSLDQRQRLFGQRSVNR